MWAEVNGERKKVACGPCIRGHRSSKCDHRDRVLVEVRKPGRPLSSCPHPSGSCSCERVVINYTIPKSSECACPSERAQPTATIAGNSRVQKNRRRSTIINPAALERAVRAGQDTETDTSSVTRTPTERSGSNDASPLSSASSTPRLQPAQKDGVSSCCKPKPVQAPVKQSSCCSSKAEPVPDAVPVKSCCSSSKPQSTPQPSHAPLFPQFGQQFQFPIHPQMPMPQYQHLQSPAKPTSQLPFGLGAPIYNHAAAAYQQQNMVPMSPVIGGQLAAHPNGQHMSRQIPEHNCHCGDSCSCFGCAAHPNNATMMEYIRLMAEFQYTGSFGAMSPPLYDMPTYPHHPGYGAEVNHSLGFPAMTSGMNATTPTQMNFQPSLDISMLSHAPLVTSASWQPSIAAASSVQNVQVLEPSEFTVLKPSGPEGQLKSEDIATTPVADSPADNKDEDTPTLSPSTFFWNEMVMPSCNDATGTCQCGDGCACVGCLTHGGHNGVALEAPALDDESTFPNLSADIGLSVDDSNNFMRFPATPS